MACGQIVGKFRFRVAANSTVDTWEPIGQPLVIVGGRVLDYALTVSRLTENIEVAPATALMTARDDQIDVVEVASGERAVASGTTHHVTDLAKQTNRFLAQPGVAARLKAPGEPGYVTGTLSVILQSCGTLAGTRAIEVSPNQTNKRPQFFAIGRVPGAGAESLRAAIVSNSVKDVEYRFQARRVDDPDAPGSWVPLGAWKQIEDGHSAVCSSDIPIDGQVADGHQLECGVAVRARSGGAAAPNGFLRIAAGLSYQ